MVWEDWFDRLTFAPLTCVSSVFFQLGISNSGSGVDYRWNPSSGGERVFCQLSPLRIHADTAGWNVCTTATQHSLLKYGNYLTT